MSPSPRQQTPIAVVGVSALFPGSADARGFWDDILAGRDLITEVPPSHWRVEDYYDPDPKAQDKTYAKRGGFLSQVDFDPLEFGVPPSNVPATDSAQILALIVAQKVLEDASQGQFSEMDRERISVVLGVTSAQELLGTMTSRLQKPVWLKALRESGIPEEEAQAICGRIAESYTPWQESSFPGLLGNVVAGRIANRFDLRGTNAVTDAACASSLAAVSMAINELQLGQSDLVITGGVDAMNDIFMFMCFSKTPALSPTGDCRPFSDNADGTLLGEGIAMLALKRLEDAERDGDRVYAVIRGVGTASDGRANSVYAPLPEGQARSLRRAYEVAGYGPGTVELVEAHGTGTKAGDAAEFAGLKLAFGGSRPGTQWCALGSVKSQIGHTKAAAGAAGLFKAVMALHHKVLPPTIKVDRPNPRLEIQQSPFYLNTQARPWIRGGDHPRRASVSSFGFGGSNFHIAMEEYVPSTPIGKRAWRLRAQPTELVLLSAADPVELATKCRSMMGASAELQHLARESQLSFAPTAAARLSLVAASSAELSEKLGRLAAAIEKNPGTPFSTPTGDHYAAGLADPGKVAFLFPGQGSQYVGMGADAAMACDEARLAWDAAADLTFDGQRLSEVVFPRPVFTDADREAQQKQLTATEWAQPALGVHSQSLSSILHLIGLRPACVAGHSFGEVTALFEAGVLTGKDLVKVARRRGELMRDAFTVPGAMTAVSGSLDAVRDVLAASGAEVVVANHNSPTQVVLSGSVEEIVKLEAALAANKLSGKRLPVATAFHSPLVAGSAVPFRAFLEGVAAAPPQVEVYGNASALPYPKDAASIREQLAAQLGQPVRFVEMIENMYSAGVRTFVEVGAGSVLTDLVGRILGDRPHQAINLDRKGRHGITALQEGLGRLALAGVPMDLAPMWAPYAPTSDQPAKKPAMTLPITGANHGQQFPSTGETRMPSQPNPPRALPVSPSPAPALDPAWIAAFQDMQRQTAETHAAYQRAMADSHIAFLKTVESSLAGMGAMCGSPERQPLPLMAPTFVPVPMPAPAPLPPVPMAEAPAPPKPAMDLEALMMAIVAEKTGYPKEMLGAHMELEADLGIDSIKRVEILSELRERSPNLPEVKAMDLVSLRTLGQIVGHMRAADGSEPTLPASAPIAETPKLDLEALMMAIVAEKTGYPKEMLGVQMELEADLGIDSIKRVEILSELRDRAPNLPEVKAMDLVTLRTLGQIIEHMRTAGGPAAEVAPPSAAAEVPAATVNRYAIREVPADSVGMALPGILGARRLVVTEDGGGVAASLVERLTSLRIPATVVSAIPADADAVVFLGGLREVGSIEEATRINREAFGASRSVAARFTITGGTFVTVQDTGGDFGLSGQHPERAYLGGIAALARTAALEWPDAAVKAIDLERGSRAPGALAEAILTELLQGGSTLEVGLHADGRRTTLGSVAVPPPSARPDGIHASSVVVASGGGRGVTAACLLALAKAKKPRMILLGRTPLAEEPAGFAGIRDEAGLKKALLQRAQNQGDPITPAALNSQLSALLALRELRGTLAALQAADSETRYLAVDVSDSAALAEALEAVRQDWGPITAVVHGAGVLADKRIEEKTDEQFDHVFDTKVAGLRALLEATQHDPLQALCLFSSVAARTGNPGQCDYAMANEVLNQVACAESARRGAACTVRSIGWGPWEGGMVTPSLKAHFQNMGVALIPIQAGANCFAEELLGGGADTAILIGAGQGEGALGAQVTPQAHLEVRVDRHSHAYLADHAIHGVPVVPMVLALEWFQRAARACRPDLVVVAVKHLKVLRGIKLHGFAGEGDRFAVSARQISADGGATLALELRGSTSVLHYTATVQMAAQIAAPPAALPAPVLEQWTQTEVYEGQVLFHGPRFQVIESVEGLSHEGIKGMLTGLRQCAWPAEPWLCDAAALDGGLQLALLWSRHVLGGAVLPMAFGEYRSYLDGLPEGPLQSMVFGRSIQESGTVCDLVLSDARGQVIAEVLGVETVVRPLNGHGAVLRESRAALGSREPVLRPSETMAPASLA